MVIIAAASSRWDPALGGLASLATAAVQERLVEAFGYLEVC